VRRLFPEPSRFLISLACCVPCSLAVAFVYLTETLVNASRKRCEIVRQLGEEDSRPGTAKAAIPGSDPELTSLPLHILTLKPYPFNGVLPIPNKSRSKRYKPPLSLPIRFSLSISVRARASSSICSLTYHCMKLCVE
jgi:hypothetical protein